MSELLQSAGKKLLGITAIARTVLDEWVVRLYRKRHSAAATAAFWAAVFLRESSRAMLGHRRSRRAVGALLGRPVPQADPPRATPAVPAP